jgi:uncharacterized membrane protein YeaQ/YmgE (transglycosylase-associated protein family)
MYFLSWILVGAVAGWLAGKILKGNDYGPTMDMGMGIGGAIAGGLLMRSARWTGTTGQLQRLWLPSLAQGFSQ